MYRITKGDITIEASTEGELDHAVKVLTDQNVPLPTHYGHPFRGAGFYPYEPGQPNGWSAVTAGIATEIPSDDGSLGRGYLGEYVNEDDLYAFATGTGPCLESGADDGRVPLEAPAPLGITSLLSRIQPKLTVVDGSEHV